MSAAISLSRPRKTFELEVPLTSSKSESNRVLLINQLADGSSALKNLSTARDTQTMQKLLASNAEQLDVLDAGTVMRFMTAYLAVGNSSRRITGTDRMCKRPIKILVEALNELGANIIYEGKDGYPPLAFKPFIDQQTDQLTIPGDISSQYISALLMIAPTLPKGLTLTLTGEIYSRPYIEMTLNLMRQFGVEGKFAENTISVGPQSYKSSSYTVESDWSGASYWYSLFALAPDDARISLKGLRAPSNQGDSAIASIMEGLGVRSTFDGETVQLTKGTSKDHLVIDFKSCPDLAQTVMACAAVKGISLEMTGLESLAIKETDRTAAMATELSKLGTALVELEKGKWQLTPADSLPTDKVTFDTYDDHRMAMALAPLCMVMDVVINDPDVVVKSYPEYWEHLGMAGVAISN